MTFVNSLKLSNIPYSYVETGEDWKDIIIFNNVDEKVLYDTGQISEDNIKIKKEIRRKKSK